MNTLGFHRKANWIWLGAYFVVVVAVVITMIAVRHTTMRELGTPEALAEWQAWREAPPNQPDAGPVERRLPSSPEPPALVLMRDYFGVMMTAAVVFSSLLFGAIMILARGALAGSTTVNEGKTKNGSEESRRTRNKTAEGAEVRRGRPESEK